MKVHLLDRRPTGVIGEWPRCGAGRAPGDLPTTTDLAAVTCATCTRIGA